MGAVSIWAMLLVAAMAVYVGLDPFGLSPIAHLPHFTAKPVHMGPLRRAPAPAGGDMLHGNSEILFLDGVAGPESLAFDAQGRGPYTGVADGTVIRWDGPPTNAWTQFATVYSNGSEACKSKTTPVANMAREHICGRPLGIRFMQSTGDLYIADAYFGLLVVGPEGGEAKAVASEAEGVPFGFTNGVETSPDGLVYFTDSTAHYRRRQFMLAALSGDDSGRLLCYNPSTKEVKVLYTGIQFPNGLTLSKDGHFLVIAETTTCRLSRFWLQGPRKGMLETLADLPGPPDNVRVNEKGEFWVALHCRHTSLTRAIFSYPWLRKALLKLPIPMKYMSPLYLGGKPQGTIMRYDYEGTLLEVLEDKAGKSVKLISEVEEQDGKLWMGSVLMPYIAIYSKS